MHPKLSVRLSSQTYRAFLATTKCFGCEISSLYSFIEIGHYANLLKFMRVDLHKTAGFAVHGSTAWETVGSKSYMYFALNKVIDITSFCRYGCCAWFCSRRDGKLGFGDLSRNRFTFWPVTVHRGSKSSDCFHNSSRNSSPSESINSLNQAYLLEFVYRSISVSESMCSIVSSRLLPNSYILRMMIKVSKDERLRLAVLYTVKVSSKRGIWVNFAVVWQFGDDEVVGGFVVERGIRNIYAIFRRRGSDWWQYTRSNPRYCLYFSLINT